MCATENVRGNSLGCRETRSLLSSGFVGKCATLSFFFMFFFFLTFIELFKVKQCIIAMGVHSAHERHTHAHGSTGRGLSAGVVHGSVRLWGFYK